MTRDVLTADAGGLYCPHGDFWIDPLRPVARAVITHAHADHARSGATEYLAARPGIPVLAHRVGQPQKSAGASENEGLRILDYGERIELGDSQVTLFPAGHILGSAIVRIETDDGVWGVSGDFKREPDPTCAPFEPFDCNVWLTECTFGLPVYRWQPTAEVVDEILAWWDECAAAGRPAVLFCYALGKAQRVLAELAGRRDRPVWLHGAQQPLTECYRKQGIDMIPTRPVSEAEKGYRFAGDLVMAPPSAAGSTWMRRFPNHSAGFVSGWMRIRGNRRRRGYDRGFVLSDHADWPGLLRTVEDMRASRVITIHGNGEALARHLRDQGIAAETWNLRASLNQNDEGPE